MSRLPHQIDTDDLLEALDSAEETEVTNWSNDVPHFLSKFKIEQGPHKILGRTLYDLYKLYSTSPVTMGIFTNTISQFIVTKNISNRTYFNINIKPLTIAKVLHVRKTAGMKKELASLMYKRRYDAFVRACRVKKGKTWVEGLVLWEIYRMYCIDSKITARIDYKKFIKISRLYFNSKRIGSSKALWYNIDDEIIGRFLTPELLENLNKRRYVTTEETKQKQSIANKGKPKNVKKTKEPKK